MWLALLSTEIEDAEEELAALLCRDVIDDGMAMSGHTISIESEGRGTKIHIKSLAVF